MSSRRAPRSTTSSRITVNDNDDHHQHQHQINDLLLKLHTLVPELRRYCRPSSSNRASASKTLKETCNYIRSLHKEVDDLSERLSEMLASMDTTTLEPEVLRSLLVLQHFNH